MSPVAINGVDKQGVYVNGVQVKQALNAANETVAKGVYAATTLSAVDADLAVGNIKQGETIFGFLGTLSASIAHDAQNKDVDAQSSDETYGDTLRVEVSGDVPGEGDLVILTVTITCEQATVLEAAYFVSAVAELGQIKLQMYIDGVAQGETANLHATTFFAYSDMGYKSVASGDRIVYLNAHKYDAGDRRVEFAGGIFAAACKV